jgi:hypothetical protein
MISIKPLSSIGRFRSPVLGAYAILAILWLWWLWTDPDTAKRSLPLVVTILLRAVPWRMLARAVPWKRARDRQREIDALMAAMNRDPIACLDAVTKNGGKVPPIACLESLAKTGQVPG